ncbi:hypothetical protein CBE01nite_09080 [Clostridium beijerinckii]|uniref:WG repeat-containing protein n=1 Tax=Clostridium beijerinckii TaxID=1520 RepID=A0AB74VIE0_CLOBE|nr:WG repeat-containing protein [Clostridium beijerinckii]NRZ25374.1 RNA polymerase subunit RPABC4/transcription elongation factor Spt4 [Clostridium beijerinckii]NYB97890.1 RNA polymerase subunit RPABC4/transcription elongation factor Spt4 [Clostridium beijerinckii]OOM25872.1 double zinc ribbon [Clostridium beijerinckii]QUN36142.1 WG repeat-containing protein [Clostridium beijerinckii]SQB13159.1 putative virion core protein (lumpy skin disease virus)-like protein [Clostridium beijerinckii]
MQCKKCGTELRENAKFCFECGEKVIKELKCKNCGNILVPNSKFCDECGTKVDYSIDNSAEEKSETTINSNALERNAEKDSKIENNKKVFNEFGLRKVSLKSTGKMGYINEKNEEVIQCIYDKVFDFYKNFVKVQKNDMFTYLVYDINTNKANPISNDDVFGEYKNYTVWFSKATDFKDGFAFLSRCDDFYVLTDEGAIISCDRVGAIEKAEGLLPILNNDEYPIYINRKGEKVSKYERYDYVGKFNDGLAVARVKDCDANDTGDWVYVNEKLGEVITKVNNEKIWTFAGEFKDGRAMVSTVNNEILIININGETISKLENTEIYYKDYGWLNSNLDGCYNYIVVKSKRCNEHAIVNRQGDIIVPFIKSEITNEYGYNHKQHCTFTTSNGDIVYDLCTGRKLFSAEHAYAVRDEFNKKYYTVSYDKKYGLYSYKEDKLTIPCIYNSLIEIDEDIRKFYEYDLYFRRGEFYIAEDQKGKYGAINHNNEIIIPFDYDEIKGIESLRYKYFIVNIDSKVGVIDNKRNITIPIKYDKLEELDLWSCGYIWDNYLNSFKNSDPIVLFKATLNGKKGVIDQYDRVYIPIKYESIKEFGIIKDRIGLVVKDNGKYGIVDMFGEYILENIYDDIGEKRYYAFKIVKNDKAGYMNIKGEIIMPFIYHKESRDPYLDYIYVVNRNDDGSTGKEESLY